MEDSVIERERGKLASGRKPRTTEVKYVPPPPPPPPQSNSSNVNLNDFLNPRSMITPGVAGSMVMLIANTLWVQFMVPQKWSALILSFLLIIPILIRFSASIFENLIYFVFNGLIVFALAINTNFVGTKLQEISGVVVQASLDTNNNTNKAVVVLKNDQLVGIIEPHQGDKNTPYMQLAANDQQAIQAFEVVSDNQKDKKSNTKQDEKKSNQENKKDEGNKKDRQFFHQWF